MRINLIKLFIRTHLLFLCLSIISVILWVKLYEEFIGFMTIYFISFSVVAIFIQSQVFVKIFHAKKLRLSRFVFLAVLFELIILNIFSLCISREFMTINLLRSLEDFREYDTGLILIVHCNLIVSFLLTSIIWRPLINANSHNIGS